ncbi:MAG TPA: hypothetical protein VJV78_41790 [Polyangiales bacterium]|nr:hypothetical protein [Polyangiales bacterium]
MSSVSEDDAGTPIGGAGAPGCTGPTCLSCAADTDCERQGVLGGTCVEARCWAPTPQCNSDQDCVKRGLEYVDGKCLSQQCRPNPKWRCEPPAIAPATGSIRLSVPIVDALSRAMIPNVHMLACNKLDLMCMQPVGDATSGADGVLRIMVPANFMGYLQQTERRDYAPAMYFLPTTLPADGMLDNFPLLPSGAIINVLALSLGGTLDPARGHMMLIADDCAGDPQAGMTFDIPQKDSKTVQFYVVDQVPQTTAKETPSEGDGGFLNVPAGTAVIKATVAKTGLESATVSVLIRAGFMTVTYIRPMPRAQN